MAKALRASIAPHERQFLASFSSTAVPSRPAASRVLPTIAEARAWILAEAEALAIAEAEVAWVEPAAPTRLQGA